MDIGAKMDIHQKIRDLATEGMGIIVISDDIPELLQTCNRSFLMHRGEIVNEYANLDLDENQLSERMRQLS